MDKMEQVEFLWDKWEQYKETAEQHEFIKILVADSRLIPAYNNLHDNYYDEGHADIFIRFMTEYLKSLGVDVSDSKRPD